MSDTASLHNKKYKTARQKGLPGWGGEARVQNLAQTLKERFFTLEKLPLNGSLLEIGCGAGNLSMELSKRGYEVTGIDFSEIAIDWAKENANAAALQVDFRVADLRNLACFDDETFDIVYDGNCLHCLIGDDRLRALQEIRRVLKPHGIFFISSLCLTDPESIFPDNFHSKSGVLLEDGIPYRQIQAPDAIQLELQNSDFIILKQVIRTDRPFGHINVHSQKTK